MLNLGHQLNHFLDAQGSQVNTHVPMTIQGDIGFGGAQSLHD
jgi:hypothetical protein